MAIFGRSWTLLKVFGFPIKINPTWFLLFFLIVFSLSTPGGLFHQWLEGEEVSRSTMWVLGVVGALGLFACLLIHELSHSVVARHTGMPVRGITLFIFGGVSEMEDEPPTAAAEFFMAVVGPLSSLALSAVFLAAWALCNFMLHAPPVMNVVLLYLAIVNFAIAAFNSLPAFPLDGGRVLRSFLWGITGNLWSATRLAAAVGSGFGMLMILGGIFSLFHALIISGIWLMFLGFFLRQAANSSLQNVMMRKTLGGENVGRFMTSPPVCVKEDLPVERFVNEYVLPYHFTAFPVTDNEGRLIGIIRARSPGEIDRRLWPQTPVKDIMTPRSSDTEVTPQTSALYALRKLSGAEGRRIIVVQDEQPVGIISLRDLMEFINLKADLFPEG